MVLLYLVRDDNFVHAVGLGNRRCVSLVCWNDILLNIVMDVIDVLNVLLMIIWAVEVDEAVWMALWVVMLHVLALWWLRLLVATAMAVGLTRIVSVVLGIVIIVRHLVVLRLARFLNGCFI